MKNAVLSLLLLFICLSITNAQDNHEWNAQIGPKATLLGGAMTASVSDNSAIFYNPGALAYVKSSSLSVVSALYGLNYYRLDNGAGTQQDLYDDPFRTNPQFFSGIAKLKKVLPISFTYGYLKKRGWDVRFTANNEGYYNIDSNTPEDETFISSFDMRQHLEEDWFGFGIGWAINEHLGFGFSNFYVSQKNDFFQSKEITFLDISNPNNIKNAGRSFDETEVNSSNYSYLALIGLSYSSKKTKIGLSITFPRVNIATFSSASIRRNTIVTTATNDTKNLYGYDTEASTAYKSPFIIDLGAEFNNKIGRIMVRLGYSGKVTPYDQVTGQQESRIGNIVSPVTGTNFLRARYAQKAIVNFGIGAEKLIADSLALLLGFHTDFNFLDEEILDGNGGTYVVSNISRWDYYHFSTGLTLYLTKSIITAGVSYVMARKTGLPYYANITNPDPSNGNYFGPMENKMKVGIDQINFSLGLTYLFNPSLK